MPGFLRVTHRPSGIIATPSITLARNTGALNPVFNISSGGTSKSNALDIYGTSSNASATLSVYVDNVLDGSTTTDGSGNWVYTLASSLSDAAHTIAATVTVGGNTSVKSSTFNVTVTAGLTSLPVSVGQNMTLGMDVTVGGMTCDIDGTTQAAGHVNANSCVVVDTHTLSLTVLPTDDDGQPSNRTEIEQRLTFPTDGQTLNISYQFILSGPVNNSYAGGPVDGWCVIGQLHGQSGSGNPPYEQLMGINGVGGDVFSINYRNGSGTLVTAAYAGTTNLARNVLHTVDLILKPHATAGIIKTTLDGVVVLNYAGGFGGPGQSPYFWKLGYYRGIFGTETQTQTIQIQNFEYALT